jgi:uncharacterized protein YgfB (UPF0149 family)
MTHDSDADILLDYYEFGEDLKTIDAVTSPSEAHGILCGQLCAGSPLTGLGWLKQYLPMLGVKREPWDALQQRFHAVRLLSEQALKSDELSFQPLLPDDEETIEDRLNALSEWCSGFMAGFGSIQLQSQALPEDVGTLLRDLQSISDVDVGSANEEGEEGESDYFEVVEYVRMAVINVFQEFIMKERLAPSVDSPATLH